MKIDTYVVNLKKDSTKKRHMEKLLSNKGISATFVEAIYGAELTSDDIKRVYSSSECIKNINREMSLGEIGCSMSHLKICREMVVKSIDVALIFEDDILISELAIPTIECILEKKRYGF